MTIRWRRKCKHYSTHWAINNADGVEVIAVRKIENCGYWYVYIGIDQDDSDGTRFEFLWEAKLYAEEQVTNGRVSLVTGADHDH